MYESTYILTFKHQGQTKGMCKEQVWAWEKTDATEESWLEEPVWLKGEEFLKGCHLQQSIEKASRYGKINVTGQEAHSLQREQILQHSYALTHNPISKIISYIEMLVILERKTFLLNMESAWSYLRWFKKYSW